MLPNEEFALACLAYYEEQGLIVDKTNGQFAHSPLTRKECDTGYHLLWEHHQQQGLIQSRDLGKCCFFTGDAKKWLLAADYFPENYFELWDIYEEFATAGAKKAGEKGGKRGGKKSQELGVGIFGMTEEQSILRYERNGRPCIPLKVTNSEGVVNTFGSISEAAKEFNCSECGVRKRLAVGKPSVSGKLKGLIFEKMGG